MEEAKWQTAWGILVINVLPSLILIVGVADDIATRKFHNWIFLSCLFIATGFAFANGGIGGVGEGLMSLGAAFFLFLPVVMLKIVGAGDLKLMLAFGMAANVQAVTNVAIFSLVWAAIFGLIRAALDKKLFIVFQNIKTLVLTKKIENDKLNKIPYTVALLFGWFSHLAINEGRWI